MKVLVTGATGFVGHHVIPQLLVRGHTVTAVSRHEARARNFAWFNHVRFIECDIHCPITNPFNQFGQPEAVIHLAWPSLPNYKALFHFEKNLPADYRFLKSLVECGVKHLLVTGTCFEYGMQGGELTEDMHTAPAIPYALAKDTLRKFLQSLQLQNAFALQWARLFYMYGEGQNPNSLLAQLDRAIEEGQSEFNMSGGEQLRDYLPVEEVARRMVLLLDHPESGGIVNVCSGKPISVRRLVEQHIAIRGANTQLNLGHYPYPDYEPMAFWGNSDKFNRWLGVEADILNSGVVRKIEF
jgi:dTDP-6-deoxy-L-talose 4-dehydrogenase (NAD+)